MNKEELLLADKGFCRELTLQEMYDESEGWRKVEEVRKVLTKSWAKGLWNFYDMTEIRYKCIHILLQKDSEMSLEDIHRNLIIAYRFRQMGAMIPMTFVRFTLIYVTLNLLKRRPPHVNHLLCGIKYMLFHYKMNDLKEDFVVHMEHTHLDNQDETLKNMTFSEMCSEINKFLNNIDTYIRRWRKAGFLITLKPQLETPQNININEDTWLRITKEFNEARICDILSLWKDNAERLVVFRKIKEAFDYLYKTRKPKHEIVENRKMFLTELNHILKGTSKGIRFIGQLQGENNRLNEENKQLSTDIEQVREDAFKMGKRTVTEKFIEHAEKPLKSDSIKEAILEQDDLKESLLPEYLDRVKNLKIKGITTNTIITFQNIKLSASENKVKETILTLLTITDEEGNRIFTDKGQWYAIYKVLTEHHGYPSNKREFCDIMINWGMNEVSPACSYHSVRKIPNQVANAALKVNLWPNYLDKAEEKFKKQIVVAIAFMNLLED